MTEHGAGLPRGSTTMISAPSGAARSPVKSHARHRGGSWADTLSTDRKRHALFVHGASAAPAGPAFHAPSKAARKTAGAPSRSPALLIRPIAVPLIAYQCQESYQEGRQESRQEGRQKDREEEVEEEVASAPPLRCQERVTQFDPSRAGSAVCCDTARESQKARFLTGPFLMRSPRDSMAALPARPRPR